MQRILLAIISCYRYCIGPFLGSNCRFTPTCSEYAQTSITRFGIIRGSWLAIKRLGCCHPWHKGGYDPVPTLNVKEKIK